MSLGGVTLVTVKAVVGKLFMVVNHQTVTGNLGDYRSGRDTGASFITLYYCLLGIRQFRYNQLAVNQDDLRLKQEIRNCLAHGEESRLENIFLINDLLIDNTDPYGEGFIVDGFKQNGPLSFT